MAAYIRILCVVVLSIPALPAVAQDNATGSEPILSYEIAPEQFENGTLALEIAIGTTTSPVEDLYGFAAAIEFPTGLFRVAGEGGALLDDGNLLKADLLRQESGVYEIAVTRRFPAQPVSGSGPVLWIELALVDDVPVNPITVDLVVAQLSLFGKETIHLTPDSGEPIAMGMAGTNVSADESSVPLSFELEPNFPNPFNPSTTIAYRLPRSSSVRLAVFDALGRQVDVLIDSARQPPGQHTVTFDASGLPSGLYIYRLEAENFVEARQMLFLK